MNIAYIANVRLPTERAHGLQIMKMCEAFAVAGASVQLFVPDKRNTTRESSDPFGYYRVKRNFKIERLWSFDFLGSTLRLGHILYWIDLLSFFVHLYFVRIPSGSKIYTRDPLFLRPFSGTKYILCVEVHDIPHSRAFIRHLKRAHKIVAITTLLKQDLVHAGIEADKILVAPDAVDIEDFPPLEINVARASIGLPLNKRIVLYTGHLYTWKGTDILARSAKFLPDILFVFVGGVEPELSRFKKEFEGCSNILNIPFVSHNKIREHLYAADVLALPNSGKEQRSTRYTSPLKLFEYLSVGKPIVASDLPSIREVLQEENACLVAPDDPQDLARGIKRVLEDKSFAQKISQNASVTAGRYTWHNRARTILDFVDPI